MAARKVLVLKFGGTSMGNQDSITQVMKIVRTQDAPVLVVVSAMAGVTNRLLALGQDALRGQSSRLASELDRLRRLHLETF